MRNLYVFSLLFVSVVTFADEPSVAYQCKDGLMTFVQQSAGSSRIDLCPSGDVFEVDAVTISPNYHMCWLNGTSKNNEGSHVLSSPDCNLEFTIIGAELSANYVGECRQICGARAKFKSGLYIQKNS